VIKLDGIYEIAKISSCQIDSDSSVTKWIAGEKQTIDEVAVCNISIKDSWGNSYIRSNLPNTEDLATVLSTLALAENADTGQSIVTNLLSFDDRLRRA
jgi:hypothetical protein